MREAVLYIAMSLDGYIADRNGKVDWLEGQEEGREAADSYGEFVKTVDWDVEARPAEAGFRNAAAWPAKPGAQASPVRYKDGQRNHGTDLSKTGMRMQKAPAISRSLSLIFHYALSTKPERKQEVHTYILWVPPLTLTLTDFTFAFHILLALL